MRLPPRGIAKRVNKRHRGNSILKSAAVLLYLDVLLFIKLLLEKSALASNGRIEREHIRAAAKVSTLTHARCSVSALNVFQEAFVAVEVSTHAHV